MSDIVIPVAFFLNARSCRCLAHFSSGLENMRKTGHNTIRENGAWQEIHYEPGSGMSFPGWKD